jgi:hypothetical protein
MAHQLGVRHVKFLVGSGRECVFFCCHVHYDDTRVVSASRSFCNVGGLAFSCLAWLATHYFERAETRPIKSWQYISAGIVCAILAVTVWHLTGLGNEKQETTARLDEITGILKAQGDAAKREKLLIKYPLGYKIFELDYQNEIKPYRGQPLLDKYELDWSVVRFTKNTADQVEIRLPGMRLKDGTGSITEGVVGGRKKVGNLSCMFLHELVVCGEILTIRDNGIVFLVGLMQKPLHQTS